MDVHFRIPLPRIPQGLGSNLVGLAGLVMIVLAIASLTSWKWGLLSAGVFAVTLTVIAQVQATPAVASELDVARSRRAA